LVAFEDLDLEAAGEKLETAINAMAGYLLDLPEPARSSLVQGIFAFAATTLFEGNTGEADSVFVALAVLEPSFEPEEGRYPSNVVDRFSAVKEGLEGRPTGSLTVKTNPPGATVYVDGLERGAAPATISDLADGYHMVSVRRVGFLPQGTLTPVNGDNSATVDLELELSDDTLVGKLDRELFRHADAIAELAKAIGAEEIAVLDYARRLSGTVVEGALVKADGTVVAVLPTTAIAEDHVLAGQTIAEAFLRAEREKIALANAPLSEESAPFWEQWWFWAAVGGAAVVVATSAAVAATVGEGGPPRNTAIFGF
jgi:hypothetical protein